MIVYVSIMCINPPIIYDTFLNVGFMDPSFYQPSQKKMLDNPLYTSYDSAGCSTVAWCMNGSSNVLNENSNLQMRKI